MKGRMASALCRDCGGSLLLADRAMAEAEAKRLKAKMPSCVELEIPFVTIACPRCDSYALGIETELGVPIYSNEVAAFLTVHDWDWWNADPIECDIRSWPDFGCLTFSPSALRAAVQHIASEKLAMKPAAESSEFADMAAVAGLMADAATAEQWHNQARLLSEQMAFEFSPNVLECVAARLCGVLVRFNHAIQPTAQMR